LSSLHDCAIWRQRRDLWAASTDAAKHAEKLGKKPSEIKFALAMENDPFAEDVRAGVLDDIERLGMRVVIDDQLAPELNDMSATLTKVKALKPDVLIISRQEKGVITAVTQMKALNVYVPVVAMTHCDSAQLAEKLPAAEYVLCAMQWHRTLNYQGELFATPVEFATEFKGAYGYEAPYQRNVAKSMVLSQVIDGKYVIVWPAERAKRDPMLPRPKQ